jgi:hypothetical protein
MNNHLSVVLSQVQLFFKRRGSKPTTNEQQMKNWWTEDDTPVHTDSQVTYRGMRYDTEMNVATLNTELARGLRMLLWAEHLELAGEERMLTIARHLGRQRQRRSIDEQAARLLQHVEERLGDPLAGLQLMIEHAQNNLRRFHAKQPLVGHLLPYVTGEEAKQQGWHFHEEHGWVESP